MVYKIDLSDFRDECHLYNNFYWSYLSQFEDGALTTEHMREWKDKLDWKQLSLSHKFNEKQITEFSDVLYWSYVSLYQNLSLSTLEKFWYKINWTQYARNLNVHEDLVKTYLVTTKNEELKCKLEYILNNYWFNL